MCNDNNKGGAACARCASCGAKESGDVKKLKNCSACNLAKYCSVKCQKEHRPQHKLACKRRAAELREEILFRQPESSHLGDCPICFLPLPLDVKHTVQTCCCKMICHGCLFTIKGQGGKQETCPYCRKPVPQERAACQANVMKRVAVNDPVALREMGLVHHRVGEYNDAVKYLTRAGKLGDASAHDFLAHYYLMGYGVAKDKKMNRYHLEEAAIAGHPTARANLAVVERNENNGYHIHGRALKHMIIAAKLGHIESMQYLTKCYQTGHISKEKLTAVLLAHQAAVDATKSPQREAAAKDKKFASELITG